MSLQEYFRLPKYMRLSRKVIAQRMTARGCPITPEAIGLWVKHNKVPANKLPYLVEVLRNEWRENNGVDVGDIGVQF